jgi:two-component system, chemotaxis family, chemotaxis protein CheY
MGARVLIVDDSRSVRSLVRAALEAAGHQVREATDGEAALEALETGPFDLIVADVNMPVMAGLAFTRAVRQIDRLRTTPVLILTTEAGDDMKQRGRAAGATGWLVKPFDPARLCQVVATVLERRRVPA